MKRLLPLLILALGLAACTSSDILTIATAAISGEIAGASADNWQPGVIYGDAALDAVVCIGAEYSSADTAAIKTAKISACVFSAESVIPTSGATQTAIVQGIDAALNAVLIAYGIPPVVQGAVSERGRLSAESHRVKLHDGLPSATDRSRVAAAMAAAQKAKR